MSRELHDLVGHTVNLLVVQAGAARLTLDRDPATTRELLDRDGANRPRNPGRPGSGPRHPARRPSRGRPGTTPALAHPGWPRLPELVERFTDSGVDVQLTVDPDLRLPRDLDLATYRIVQEALTNTLKHAAPCAATVVVRRE